jgi:hypothetical protein
MVARVGQQRTLRRIRQLRLGLIADLQAPPSGAQYRSWWRSASVSVTSARLDTDIAEG